MKPCSVTDIVLMKTFNKTKQNNNNKKKKSRNEFMEVSTHPFPFQLTVQAPYQEKGVCLVLTLLWNTN